MRDDVVWGRLHETEAFIKAQNVVAASIGTPAALLEEIEDIALWVLKDTDSDQQSKRLVHVCSAFALLAFNSIEVFARQIEESKLEVAGTPGEPDDEAMRDTMLYLLNTYAANLRQELD